MLITAEDIKDWRTKYNFTQAQLAGKLGVAVETVARWEGGSRKPPLFLKLALEELSRRDWDG